MIEQSNLLYKYASLDIAETIAVTSTLKFSNPSKFNDPFDCDITRLKFDLTSTDEIVKNDLQILKAKNNSHPSLTNELFERGYKESQINKIKKSSVCCFSFISDNLLMWAHYANKHFGVCLIFDNLIENKFINIPDTRLTTVVVNYKAFTPINYLENKIEGIKNLFGTKSIDWKYECEYRIIILEQEGLVRFNSKFLTGIIFGLKVTQQEIERFQNTCKREKINLKFKKVVRHQDSLIIEEV